MAAEAQPDMYRVRNKTQVQAMKESTHERRVPDSRACILFPHPSTAKICGSAVAPSSEPWMHLYWLLKCQGLPCAAGLSTECEHSIQRLLPVGH